MQHHRRAAIAIGSCASRKGITLLEVLISLGILSVGLASVVALIPAGGDQAKKAMIDDRRGTLGPNALADCVTRGLLAPAKWSPAQPPAPNYRLIFDPVLANALAPAGLTAITTAGNTAGPMADEIFRAQDDLAYKLPDDEDAPSLPLFFNGPAKRLSEGNFSWLATLIPVDPASPFHRLSVVTIHRRGEVASLTVGASSLGSYIEAIPTAAMAAEDVRRFLPPGAVIMLTDDATTHEWRTVAMASPQVAPDGTVAQIELTLNRDVPSSLNTLHAVEGANGLYERVVRLEEMSPWSQ